jgi:hypothetical protein
MDDKNNNKTPAEIERAKTKKERAQDVAYTLNNAIVCTTADLAVPAIGNWIQQLFGNKSQLGKWYIAEFVGDYGAIPPTIWMQRHFPGTMAHISETVEPVFKKSFRKGAERATKEWAKNHGVSEGSDEYKAHIDKVYKYEVSHIPQALVWAGSATTLNVALQLAMDKGKTPVHHILSGKIGGSVFAAGATLAGRTFFPDKAEKIDRYISKHFVLPAGEVEEKLEKIVGHHDEDEHKNSHLKKDDSWKERIKISNSEKSPEIRI